MMMYKVLTVCTSEIYKRKYSDLSETSLALCESMLPWQMFSFNSGLAKGGCLRQCIAARTPYFYIASSKKCSKLCWMG